MKKKSRDVTLLLESADGAGAAVKRPEGAAGGAVASDAAPGPHRRPSRTESRRIVSPNLFRKPTPTGP